MLASTPVPLFIAVRARRWGERLANLAPDFFRVDANRPVVVLGHCNGGRALALLCHG